MLKHIYSYALSFATITTVLIYGVNLPKYITHNDALVKEYYFDNFERNLIFDFVLIAIYICIACFVIKNTISGNVWSNALMVAITTAIISGAFCFYFLSNTKTSSFFSRWFHTVKYKAVLYDILLVTSVFVLYKLLYNKIS